MHNGISQCIPPARVQMQLSGQVRLHQRRQRDSVDGGSGQTHPIEQSRSLQALSCSSISYPAPPQVRGTGLVSTHAKTTCNQPNPVGEGGQRRLW